MPVYVKKDLLGLVDEDLNMYPPRNREDNKRNVVLGWISQALYPDEEMQQSYCLLHGVHHIWS